jgi:hypothetical protein
MKDREGAREAAGGEGDNHTGEEDEAITMIGVMAEEVGEVGTTKLPTMSAAATATGFKMADTITTMGEGKGTGVTEVRIIYQVGSVCSCCIVNSSRSFRTPNWADSILSVCNTMNFPP